MQTDQTTLNNLSPMLTEMGYSNEMIQLAFGEAKSSDLEHILDLLESRKDHYNSVINKPKEEEEDEVSSEDMRLFRALYNKKPKKQPLKKIENVMIQDKSKEKEEEKKFEDPKPGEENRRQKRKNNKKNKEPKEAHQKEPQKEVKEVKKMDQVCVDYLDSSIQSFKYTWIKDPNWHISELVEVLKSLKFKTSTAAANVVSYLNMEDHFPKLEEFKHKIYSLIIKIVTMRVTKKDRIHIENLESALKIAFELNLFKVPQMKSIITLAPKFCAKTIDKMSEETYEFLEKIYQDALAKQGGNDLNYEPPGNIFHFSQS